MLYSLNITNNEPLSYNEPLSANQLIKQLKLVDLQSNASIFQPGKNFTDSYINKLSYFNKYAISIDLFGGTIENNETKLSSIVCKRIPVYYPLETIFSNNFFANSIISQYIDSEPYLYPHYKCDDFNWYDFYLKPIDTNYGVINYKILRFLLEQNPGFTVYFDNHLKYLVSGVTNGETETLFNYENYLKTKQINYSNPIINGNSSIYHVPDGFKYVSSILFDDIPGESAVILEYVNNNNTRVRCKYQYYSSIPYEYACMSSIITDPNDSANTLYINHFDRNTETLLSTTLSTYNWEWKPTFGDFGSASFTDFSTLYLYDHASSLILPEEHIRHIYNLNIDNAAQYHATWSKNVYIPDPDNQISAYYTINGNTYKVNTTYYSNLRNQTNCISFDITNLESPILLTNVSGTGGYDKTLFGYTSRISNKLVQ